MSSPKILTGIDVPAGTPGGSIALFTDLYLAPDAPIQADAFMLAGPVDGALSRNLTLLDVSGRAEGRGAYSAYVDRLVQAVRAALTGTAPELLHLHHLAFGASPALIEAFPEVPAIAFIHGTDLLVAQADADQRDVLTRMADHASAIIAPTEAMASRLCRLVPHLAPDKIHHVGWGLPGRLLDAPPERWPVGRRLPHLLYAGRLTPEKGFDQFAAVCASLGLPLSVAAPTEQWHQARYRLGHVTETVDYLGWFRRDELWSEFTRHDVLAVPSVELEAFCLTAVEAQAAGLPVVYRPVDGLSDVLGDSAMPVDLYDPAALAKAAYLLRSEALRDELRERGRTNAGRFRLSATAAAITALGRRVVAAPPAGAR
ncbi:glycosyltransferase involved in cell wall biosynthesis [Catenulispora sp. GAS73]|uniref:glycosyltransferase family 4 protein n=1 Tax=Catenulispora sp. GAS73 TaxID=3156269 RepID=UPI0035167C96